MDKSKQIIIGLVGEPGSGKDTVSKYLTEKYGAMEIRFQDPLLDALKNYMGLKMGLMGRALLIKLEKSVGNITEQ